MAEPVPYENHLEKKRRCFARSEGTNWLLHGRTLEANAINESLKDIDFLGISFNYPEEKVEEVKWMGRGPYRVWKYLPLAPSSSKPKSWGREARKEFTAVIAAMRPVL